MATLLGLGNPILDISANVTHDFLKKYDVTLNNAILCEDKHKPVYKDLVDNFDVSYIAGGSTQNSIRVAQWMLQKAGATAFIGCVGKDEYGDQLKKSTEADGVAVHYLVDEKTPTGTCACLIVEKERSMIANLAAANEYKPSHLNSEPVAAVWKKAKAFYTAGFHLTVSPEAMMTIGQHACTSNVPFCMNLSAPFICEFFNEPLIKCMEFVDFLFGNESEAVAFGKKMGFKDTSVKGVALEIAKMPKTNSKRDRFVVFTQGSESTIIACGDKVTEVAVPKLTADQIVDSNGAGDAFVGGFLAAYLSGRSVEAAAEVGHYSASVILGVSGTALPSTPPKFDLTTPFHK